MFSQESLRCVIDSILLVVKGLDTRKSLGACIPTYSVSVIAFTWWCWRRGEHWVPLTAPLELPPYDRR